MGIIEHTVTKTTNDIFFVVRRIVLIAWSTCSYTTKLHLLQDIYTPVYVCVCVCVCAHVCKGVYSVVVFVVLLQKSL